MTHFKEVIRLFKYYRMRFIFSLIGIAIGIGSICALIALNGIVNKNSKEYIQKFGGSRFVLNVMTSANHDKKISQEYLEYRKIQQFVKSLSDDFTLVPYRLLAVKARVESKDIEAISIATNSDIFSIMQWNTNQGRKLHPLDKSDKVVVIGANIAKKLQEKDNSEAIGKVINLDGHYFTVVGILPEIEFNPILDFDVNYAVLLDLNLLGRFENNTTLDSFIVQGKGDDLKTSENKLKARLAKKLGTIRFFFRDVLLFEKALFKQVTLTMNILTIVAAITLFLGIISILNLLLILIEERKKEIGLRMSVGATPYDIGRQFLTETICLCLLGGSVGIILGQGLAYFIVSALDITYYSQWFSWIIGIPVTAAIGGIVGLIPGRLASKFDPVKLING